MSAARSSADTRPEAEADWQAQTVWVAAAAAGDGTPRMATFPPKQPARERFLICNRPELLAELLQESPEAAGWQVVPIAELHRLLRPEASAESVAEMMEASAESRQRRESGVRASGLRQTLPPEPRTLNPTQAQTGGLERASPDAVADGEAPEQSLWRLWEGLSADLAALPLWALETAGAIYRELEEEPLARLLGHFAATARRRAGQETAWITSFPATVKRVERPDPPALADCTALDPDEVAALLAPGGALARLVPDYEPRPGQLAMLRAVVEAFNGGRHLLAEAGTGVGKSLAYLLPAALWARLNDTPVVISTNTRNLQNQLVEKDLPVVQRLLASLPAHGGGAPHPLRAALIKGRSNYLCLRRFGALLEQGQFDLTRQELRQFARAVCWSARTRNGDLDDLTGGAGVEPAFMALLSSLAEDCNGRACRAYRRCFLQKAREAALRADLIVANHALVFAEMGTGGIALPKHAQLVLDEAHNLEEAATRHFSAECSPARLKTLLRRLASGHGSRRGGLLETLRRRAAGGAIGGGDTRQGDLRRAVREALAGTDDLRDAGKLLFQALYRLLPANGEARRYTEKSAADEQSAAAWRAVREAQTAFAAVMTRQLAALKTLADTLLQGREDELNLMVDDAADIAGMVQALSAFAADTEMVLAGANPEAVFWVQRARAREPLGEAWAAPLRIGPRLAAELYEQRQSVIFSSATLSVGGSFRYIGERLGLDLIEPERLHTCIAPSPFDYVRQCALLAPSYLPEPNADEPAYVEELSQLLRRVALLLHGRTLALFTSYDMLRQCASRLETPLKEAGIRLLSQGESGSRDQITRIFRRGDRCVLLGTHSFWEGVDVVGEALSCVVLARLPFTSPAEPIFSARCEGLERDGGSSFGALALPAAVLRLRQGFGRLIRHRHDRGLVIVADTRLLTKSYGAVFRRSLPCPTIACPDAATVLERAGAMLA
ncbi:MAG: helicase C-terminal domain-containing protein [Kiritimatiellae bacterium]|nr:helicase C-terminal domain-containing protein [Kiritimatiellia bacterium]